MSDRRHVELQRQYSRNSDNAAEALQTEALQRIVLEEINLLMKRPEKPQKSFICYHDLERIWSDQSRITTLLQPDCPDRNQIDFIQSHMKRILSTLVLVGADKCLANFRSRLFNPESGEAHLTDEGIPFEKNQLFFLDSEPALRQNFYEYQFRFKPVVITVTGGQGTVIDNQMMRLPFESRKKDIGSGGYGKVDRIGISPRCFTRQDGSSWEKVYVVACKKIKLPSDFDQEVNNLQILKESLTHHHRIMLHLTTIEHGPNRYILLPYAQYSDLELFLHCGIGPDGKLKYEFDKFFKQVRNGDVTNQLIHECWSLAHALEWLHNGITVEKTSHKVFCVHMDLKPANILIQPDPQSAIGKWVISDFGISVLKEKANDSDFVSIGDYYSQLTVHTRPKRHEGTYQAPEVKQSEAVLDQTSNLTPDQRGIGRKSDIWSLGCIFSEVLAFALGRDQLVCEFQSARRGREGKDYFYAEKVDHGLLRVPNSMPKQYQVHPSVLLWLDGRCGDHGWVDCWVETIKKILIVDTVVRPNATDLTKLISHVRDHKDNPQLQVMNCILLAKDGDGIAREPPVPLNLRQEQAKQESLNKYYQAQADPSIYSPTTPILDSSNQDLTIGRRDVISVTSKTSSGTNSSVSTTFARPASAHGIMVESDVLRTLNNPIRTELPRLESSKFKAISTALTRSSTGIRAAYLANSSVYFYQLNVEETSAISEQTVPLPSSSGWKGIAVAGWFLAVWGFSSHRLLHICDIREHQRRLSLPASCNIEMLVRVAVSTQGAAALIYWEQIRVLKIDTQTLSDPLLAKKGQKFTNASFNDTGDLLFAWAYGQVNSIYVWSCQDCAVNEKPKFEKDYEEVEKKRDPTQTRVIPYNTYPGCIISTSDKRFYSAQVTIFNVVEVVIFRDHSMITIEKVSHLVFKHRFVLKEYKIEYESNKHLIRSSGVEICKLEASQDEPSRLLVTTHGKNIIAVVCYPNATVTFVKFVPKEL